MKLFNSFLSLSISFTLLMGCQEDLLPTISEINDDHLKPSVVGLDDEDYYSLTSEFNSYSSGRIAGNLNFEDALKTFDESGDAKYSVEIPNDDILLTQNLILGRDSLGFPYGFVFEYEADSSWVSENHNAVIWESFTGFFRVYGKEDSLLTEVRIESGETIIPDNENGRSNCRVYVVTVNYYVSSMTEAGASAIQRDGSYSYLEVSGCVNYVPDINIRYDVYTGGLATEVHYPTLGGGNNTIGVATSVGQPCPGDPIKNPRIAASLNSGLEGGTYGETRSQGTRSHDGLDIFANVGTNLYSINGGRVYSVGNSPTLGKFITIQGNSSEGMVYITYAHLKEVFPSNGSVVSQGEPIGLTGRSGNAEKEEDVPNPHVHIELRKVEGVPWKDLKTIDPELVLHTKFDGNFQPIYKDC